MPRFAKLDDDLPKFTNNFASSGLKKEPAKAESTKVGEMYSHFAAEANEWAENEVKAHEAEEARLLAQRKKGSC